jgi:hypothetical protein
MAEMKNGALEDRWQPVFRHSAGRLGSQYLTAIRTEKRLLGWKTAQPERLSSPPKDFGGEGAWVDIGPGATLLSFAPGEWVAGGDVPEGYLLSRVVVDGTDTPQFALLKTSGNAAPARGARLNVRFADEPAEGPAFWFEPAGGAH